jgi:hypothetical protein
VHPLRRLTLLLPALAVFGIGLTGWRLIGQDTVGPLFTVGVSSGWFVFDLRRRPRRWRWWLGLDVLCLALSVFVPLVLSSDGILISRPEPYLTQPLRRGALSLSRQCDFLGHCWVDVALRRAIFERHLVTVECGSRSCGKVVWVTPDGDVQYKASDQGAETIRTIGPEP